MGPIEGTAYPVNDFKDNGFAFCPGVLTTEEAQAALQQIQEYSKANNLLHITGNDRFKTHLFLSEINKIVHNPKLLQAVRQALGTPFIALWSSDLNIKQPDSREYFSEHQDSTYTGLQPAEKCVTAWIALSDPVGSNEGCLAFLMGSQTYGQLPHVEELHTTTSTNTQQEINMLSRGQRVLYDRRDENWVAVPLRAGDATLHSFYTIHKSGNNQHPSQPRVGLALRYMAQSVRQTGPVRELITFIENEEEEAANNVQRRKELEEFFDLEPRLPVSPTNEDVKAGRQAHDIAMRRENSNYFLGSSVEGYQK